MKHSDTGWIELKVNRSSLHDHAHISGYLTLDLSKSRLDSHAFVDIFSESS